MHYLLALPLQIAFLVGGVTTHCTYLINSQFWSSFSSYLEYSIPTLGQCLISYFLSKKSFSNKLEGHSRANPVQTYHFLQTHKIFHQCLNHNFFSPSVLFEYLSMFCHSQCLMWVVWYVCVCVSVSVPACVCVCERDCLSCTWVATFAHETSLNH